jgi:multicomponent Na+:H+ antiporter subunit A
VVPGAVLAAVSVVAGVVPSLLDPLVDAADAWLGPVPPVHLALWHGPTAALGLSVLVLLGGAALVAARGAVERLQARVPRVDGAQRAYDGSVTAIMRTAGRVTGVAQSGSLPVYLGTILLVAVGSALPLLVGATRPARLDLVDNPLQIVPCIVMIAAAVGAAVVGRRFAAVVLLGAVGFGMAALFLAHGAPDLAVTQLLIETLSIVAFVLVLRRLPDRFPHRLRYPGARRGQAIRVAVAASMGVFVFGFALAAAGERSAPPVSDEYAVRAQPDAGGRNVVNVIIVDFRGFDTLGEIAVIATAALGVSALVAAGRRDRPGAADDAAVVGPPPAPTPLPAAEVTRS